VNDSKSPVKTVEFLKPLSRLHFRKPARNMTMGLDGFADGHARESSAKNRPSLSRLLKLGPMISHYSSLNSVLRGTFTQNEQKF